VPEKCLTDLQLLKNDGFCSETDAELKAGAEIRNGSEREERTRKDATALRIFLEWIITQSPSNSGLETFSIP
jgi:hypothetical protein